MMGSRMVGILADHQPKMLAGLLHIACLQGLLSLGELFGGGEIFGLTGDNMLGDRLFRGL